MREILFRGKSKFHGAWEYGDLITSSGDFFIGNTVHNAQERWCHVHPETVGQFIGLLDKNGKRIFEGDIVSVRGKKRVGIYRTEIIYEGQGFKLKENKTYLHDFMERPSIQFVIGNIHDKQQTK